jgi:hypothetical protein
MEEVLKETGEAPEKKEETPKAESGGAGAREAELLQRQHKYHG